MIAWSKTWPTEPGWYWTRRRGDRVEPARVGIGGTGAGSHRYYVVAGGFAYQSEQHWHDLEWGPRIPEPGRLPVTLSLGYGEALIVEKALRNHAAIGVPNYAGMCNRLADTLAEQCAEIGRASEERREEPDQ